MVRKEAYNAISFKDERWMEKFGYCHGDDQMFFNKMHVNGFKVLVHYNCKVKNLDAATGGRLNVKENHSRISSLHYIIWHRTCYASRRNFLDGLYSGACFWGVQFTSFFAHLLRSIVYLKPFFTTHYVRGLYKGIQFTKSPYYKTIPPFKNGVET